jgi:hypothetical protein
MEIIPVPGHRVDDFWFHVEPWLSLALEKNHGEMELEDVLEFCRTGKVQLFGLWDGEKFIGSYITELVIFPRMRQVHVLALGAENFDPWIELVSQELEEWRKKCQCHEVVIVGRHGWIKKLKAVGFKQRYTILARGPIEC